MPPDKRRPGPKPERLKIDGEWEDAIDQALSKERPEGGWPEPSDTDETKGEGDEQDDESARDSDDGEKDA